ncbi:MAG TPA: DUF1015 domain-containing protein [Actinopolymorphaceae bacterium]
MSGSAQRRPLVLSPFRGLRYSPSHIPDLGSVTAPPYDTLDPRTIAELEADQPYNIVRVILPRSAAIADSSTATSETSGISPSEGTPEQDTSGYDTRGPTADGLQGVENHYQEAAELLAHWRREGILTVDPVPALYVYEQRLPSDPADLSGDPSSSPSQTSPRRGRDDTRSTTYVLRGLLGSVALRDPDERVILPHEDVMPGPVQDRFALMHACQANLEPILLAYDGGGAATSLVEAAVTGRPMIHARTRDGAEHLVWPITDPGHLAEIAADLAPRQALIADGHHRYATYLRLQRHLRATVGAGPWDSGLALLVDQQAHPLRLSAIHRVVRGLSLEFVRGRIAPPFQLDYFDDAAKARFALAQSRPHAHAFLLTDGRQWLLVRLSRESRTAHDTEQASPVLDTDVLHTRLLRQVAGVPEERISYVHDWRSAVDIARQQRDCIAVLLNPVDYATVHMTAQAGHRMPRKSTSFGPKPRTGLVMRAFADNPVDLPSDT